MSDVSLRAVKKSFGAVNVIKGVDLDIADGEFCVFVGPSGCGKSTLLRMIAGLEKISEGSLSIGSQEMTDVGPSERGVAMVFQSYALYPHMTVAENIGFGLKMTGHPKALVAERTAYAAKMLQLEPLLQRKPGQLSGGQRQRVAIGRAIVRNPDVFLFDEPLSNLDAALRVQMRSELSNLHQDLKATMIYVTHDQVEAMTMADKIVVLSAGRIEQVGAPLELYHRPKNLFVAGFIGSPKMNFLTVPVTSGENGRVTASLPGGASLSLDTHGASVKGATMTLGIRPEHLEISTAKNGLLEARVDFHEYLGGTQFLYCQLADSQSLVVEHRSSVPVAPGELIQLSWKDQHVHLFDAAGRRLRAIAER